MKLSDFDYILPESLIAQTPVEPRDHSRLLIYNRKTNKITHTHFYDIIDYLSPNDALFLNETKVIPARLFGAKENGVKIEFLLLRRIDIDTWEIICKPGKKLKINDTVIFSDKLSAKILDKKQDGITLVRFLFSGVFEQVLDEHGSMPLPPYITEKLNDKQRYQTVYAKTEGSGAAPTAGLHFTPQLLEKIEQKGVNIIKGLLHVGLGTFRPVKSENILEHKMHSEYFELSQDSADKLNQVRKNGGKIIACGTTSIRILETCCNSNGIFLSKSGNTDIFIYPPYEFKGADSLITNFHLPKSTLLMLVSAFASREKMLDIYNSAIENKYRFFSFGDAMLII